MRIIDEPKLGFDDVMIIPKRSTLESRKQVNLHRSFKFKYGGEFYGVPIMAANMSTVGTLATAKILNEYDMFTCFHKFVEQTEDQSSLHQFLDANKGFYALSLGSSDDMDNPIYQKANFLCLDVANGYTVKFVDFVKRVREKFPDKVIIAGNTCTPEMVEELILSGADIVKHGISGGNSCLTRSKTGIGYPQLSAVIEGADAAHGLKGHIISDGGIRTPSDLCKAFGAGADFVMIGSMFGAHDENAVLNEDGKPVIYGMSSSMAMKTFYGKVDKYRTSEGRVSVLDKTRGSLHDTVQDYLGGLRSAATYIGAASLKEFSKRTTFIKVTEQLSQGMSKYTIGD